MSKKSTKNYRTYTIFIKRSDPLFEVVDHYAFLCKNLKNVTLYFYRQNFFNGNKTINANQLINHFTKNKQSDFCAIPRKVSQQIVRQTSQDFASFKALYKLYQKQLKQHGRAKKPIPESKKISKPNLPKYLDKEKGRANVIFTKQAVHKKELKKGILSLSSFDPNQPITFKLGKLAKVITYENLQEVKLVKVPNGYEVKITYIYRASKATATADKVTKNQVVETNVKNLPIMQTDVLSSVNDETKKVGNAVGYGKVEAKQSNPINSLIERSVRAISVDLGVNNLMTVANNINIQTFIIQGRALKSFNQYFNKRLAKLKSKLDKAKNELVKASIQRKIDKLYQDRKHKINDFLHKASRCLINHAVCNDIDTIVVGYNEGWKQEINMGKVNNQKFAYIPFRSLLNMIQYKAEAVGIEVIVTEESYTSKCSFLDNEEIRKHETYKGKRTHRGLFKSANGMIINADVNGAFNILRKVIGNFEFDPIKASSTPKTINVLKQKSIIV